MAINLETNKSGRRKWLFLALITLVIIFVGFWLFGPKDSEAEISYRLQNISRGTISDTVSSTGTISAVGMVELRPQIVAKVIEVNVDYNTPVTQGQVLAKLDPESFEQQILQVEADLAIAKASLVSSRAAIARSEADLRGAQASVESLEAQLNESQIGLNAAQRELDRQRELFSRNVVTAVAVDNAQVKFEQSQAQFERTKSQMLAQAATLDSRKASLVQSEAGLVTAQAQVQQKEAKVNAALIELTHTEITAPVDGTVVDRNIETGQTVSTSTNSDPLFIIAQSLQRMQVEVSVDEADIGSIRESMQVSFTVDAYPGREYEGVIRQVRYAPQTVQNVVIYTVIVTVPNRDMSLLPGMTATARIILAEREDALKIPNAALRYQPPGFSAQGSRGETNGVGGGNGGGGRQNAGNGRPCGEGRMARPLAAFTPLNLTENQCSQVTSTLQSGLMQQVQALRDEGVQGEAMGARIQEFIVKTVRGVLTSEQLVQLESIISERENSQQQQSATRPGRVFMIGENGTPEPINIEIGLTDGGFTELISGALTEDQEIIVGSNEIEETESSRGRLRFGF